MSLVPKTATIQVRVVPVVKRSSEEVLWRIGLTMSQAVELFLRRVMVDERLPFEIVALEESRLQPSSLESVQDFAAHAGQTTVDSVRVKKKGDRPKKELKKFFGARTPSKIRAETASKKGRI